MIRDLRGLLKIQFLRFFGINEILHSRDRKKQGSVILMAFCYLMAAAVLMLYAGAIAYALYMLGMSELIPSYLLVITSLVILVFTIFKTNGILFGANDFELLSALPLSPETIVASRFLTMYIGNFLFALLIMLPVVFVYITFVRLPVTAYVMLVLSVCFIPLIPMTIAAMIGALVTAITARMKHKNLLTVVLTLILTLGIMVLSFGGSSLSMSDYQNLALVLTRQLEHAYPLTVLYAKAMNGGSVLHFFLFVLISVAVFYLFVRLVAWKYVEINSALKVRMTRTKYRFEGLSVKSPLMALFDKERRRFFSSPNYVLNAGIGYVLMVVMGAAVLITGPKQLEAALSIPGFARIIGRMAPLLISWMLSISSTTSSAISLEGKQWDMLRALPVTAKTIFDSKILLNLAFSVPASLLTSLLFALALPLRGMEFVWLFIIPIVYSFFAAVAGLSINLAVPNFKWDNEITVIKRSVATLLFMAAGMISIGVPFVAVLVFAGISANLVFGLTTLVLSAITLFLYGYNQKLDLRKIE